VFIVSVVSKLTVTKCRSLQFLHKMFMVFALLLDDVLLKCFVTEVVLFSVVAFKTLTFGWRRGSVVRTSVCSWPTLPDLRLIHG